MEKLKNIKILYIDDEDLIRSNAVEYLEFYCDNVYEAKDGLEGIEVYEKFKPDIIITDIKMPKLNGLEMVRQIRQKDKTTRIIVATAFLETSYLLEAIDLGLVKYLTKPITEDKLLPILKSCVLDVFEDKSIFFFENDISFDMLNKTLFKNEIQIMLTKKELMFLELLLKNSKRAVKYSELSNYVWNGNMSEDAIRSIVKELRKKISKQTIKNVSGIGYQVQVLEKNV
ncbi:response regulator transcription factor [Poseidonibacter lekithochrous]|uniref:response regulator transcription factor n=1 Tax=Poseidonibacter lekithochrous TaxID=1904463 RepID=UPI0008FC74B9|nr:response regulator transcription factor [Poseidonibacter lekithochrous]QKJ22501.1 two-component system response regulator [Poseidonibacter lekithochrous]